MKSFLLSCNLLLLTVSGFSQTNVQAWYADGQVFIVWQIALPLEETYAIYASPAAFTNTDDATLIGRPFVLEYLGYGLKDNLNDTLATYRIPDGQGGLYQLALNEGLFVFTPHQSGALYFAVTPWGNTAVTPGQNITGTPVAFTYDPIGDPVECHLQRTFPSPFAPGFICQAYCLWADGRQDHWDARADFPIMANAGKNGMPGLFLLSAPVGLDTTQAFPLSVWLHGGGGTARQSLAGSRKEVNIDPQLGILLAHDDKMYGYRGPIGPHPDQPTWHFGWGKTYNPFLPDNPLVNDTIINYTQQRYLWVDSWLSRHFNIDTTRINIHGHSMGSAGALALAKAHPYHYASASLFNTGCAGPLESSNTSYTFGLPSDNFPTNLLNYNNEPVRFYDLWDLYTNCSPERDLPLIRHWHGKNDDNGTMQWSPIVVENYHICDSLGTGIQNYWSERPHGIDMAPDFNDHWIMGIPADEQTAHDNVDFPEMYHRSDQSFPAFFNHRLDSKNNDPGTGLIGINNGDGDNWGTWGGYHRWDNVSETPETWQVTAWLEGDAVFPIDNCPEDFLTADIAIRRPQTFLRPAGETIYWAVTDQNTGINIQTGFSEVQSDGLAFLEQVNIFREDIAKVVISITLSPVNAQEVKETPAPLMVFPNPTAGLFTLREPWLKAQMRDLSGRPIRQWESSFPSPVLDISDHPAGVYFLEIWTPDGQKSVGKVVKVK